MSRWRPFLRAYVEAATRPSAAALVGSLLVALGCTLGTLALVTPSFLARLDPGYLMRSGADDYGRLTAQVHALAATPPAPSAFVVLGASAAREALPGVEAVTAEVQRRTARTVVGHDLTTSALSLWEYVAVLEQLGDGFDGVVVLGLSPRVLSSGPTELAELVEQPRIGFRSDALDAEIRRAGLEPADRTGNLVLDNLPFYLARVYCLARVVLGPATPLRARYRPGKPPTAKKLRRHRGQLAAILAGYDANVGPNIDRLARLVERLRARGRVEVLLLEAPVHPAVDLYPADLKADYTTRLERFADTHGVHYRSLDAAADLRATDFHDVVHIVDPDAERRYAAALAKAIADLLPPEQT